MTCILNSCAAELKIYSSLSYVFREEEIVFEKVFPLYGAVDIRNSTVQRNEALQKDLGVQFSILIETLEKLKEETGENRGNSIDLVMV